jgi:hypothetical protein
MSMPALPDWLPWWVPILVLVPALLYALALLLMPFAVFGVKGRLEAMEARLDEIQGEIRALSLRLREPIADEMTALPPIPPSPDEPPPRATPQRARAEPRLDWPRRAPT